MESEGAKIPINEQVKPEPSKSTLDLFREKYVEENNLRTQIEQKIAPLFINVTCSKNEITDENITKQINFRANDLISIKIRPGQKGEPIWSIKNETLAQTPKIPKFEGYVVDATPEDVKHFIDQLDPTKIGIHKLKDIPDEMQRNPDKKSFILKDRNGQTVSLAYISTHTGSRQAFIGDLATSPEFAGKGAGSALLSELKKRFDYLNLSAIPFGINPEENRSRDKLYKFYKENGFVNASEWSNKTLSLDDLEKSSKEQILNEYQYYKIGNDNITLNIEEFKRLILGKIVQDSTIFDGLPEEIKSQLMQWKEVNNQRKLYRDLIDKSSNS